MKNNIIEPDEVKSLIDKRILFLKIKILGGVIPGEIDNIEMGNLKGQLKAYEDVVYLMELKK